MTSEILNALPAKVRAELDRRQITLAEVAAVLDVGDGEVALLTGSYATGEENATSDLDFMVITRKRAPARPPGSANHPSIFGDSFDAVTRDLTVNIEYVEEGRVNDLCAVLDRVRRSGAIPDLPNLQALEVRLAQRLTTGVALTGADRLAAIGARIDIEVVRAGVSALAFFGSMSLLAGARVSPPPARSLFYRGAGESLLLAAVNAFGPITYDVKQLCSRAAALAAGNAMPMVVREWQTIAGGPAPRADGADVLLDMAVDLHARFGQPGTPPIIRPMLSPFVPTWAWTGREFA